MRLFNVEVPTKENNGRSEVNQMKKKTSRKVTPAKKQEVTKMDEIDEIIWFVACWLEQDVDMATLKTSAFYEPVKEKIRQIVKRMR